MATESGMPHFIGHTTVEFEMQLYCITRVTRSAVFSCFVPFSHCFPCEITPTFKTSVCVYYYKWGKVFEYVRMCLVCLIDDQNAGQIGTSESPGRPPENVF